MVGYLRGEVLEHSDGKILLGISAGPATGPTAGAGVVGYLVSVPQSVNYGTYLPGQSIELYIYSHVREDAFDLYGFSTRTEKELFLTLLSVNGIGPKSALGILSGVLPETLIEAIIQGNQHFLTQIPGIGKKTAERVVVELRDSVRKKVDAGGFSTTLNRSKNPGLMGQANASSGGLKNEGLDILSDAKAALMTLGYRENEIYPLLKRVFEESEPRPKRAEDLIKTALRQLI